MTDLEALLALTPPDPVDLFEDELARRLGLQRGPGMEMGEWRRLRVAFIDSHPRSDEVGDALQGELLAYRVAGA